MRNYLDLMSKVVSNGIFKSNRTGVDHIGIHDEMLKFDMDDGFPAVTTKRFAFKTCIAEMLGFLRGYSNASDFRRLGCKVWDANANENETWLINPRRKGKDDLGRIYGVQARRWLSVGNWRDQLSSVYKDLSKDIDNRREIVTHWNPGELDQMALPPCHLLYQFGIQGDKLNLIMYQRSCDMPLGVPFNIAGYAWLLSVFAQITGHSVGVFSHVLHDIHIYRNQLDLVSIQVKREPFTLPRLKINPDIKTLKDLETWVTVDDFKLVDYNCHLPINYPFSV